MVRGIGVPHKPRRERSHGADRSACVCSRWAQAGAGETDTHPEDGRLMDHQAGPDGRNVVRHVRARGWSDCQLPTVQQCQSRSSANSPTIAYYEYYQYYYNIHSIIIMYILLLL